MIASRIFLLALLLIAEFVFLDFPGVKIIVTMGAAVVLINWIYTKIVEKSFGVERATDTYRIFPGVSEPNNLMITNRSRFPIHALEIVDTVDNSISVRGEYAFITSVLPKGEKAVVYPILGRKRGKYILGPTEVHFTDLLGLFSFEYEVDTRKEVIVFPSMMRMNQMRYRSMQPLGLIKNPVPIFEDQTIITGLRDFQFGDEIRKINWKISAKHNKYMVNTYQPAISCTSLIVLNFFEPDYNFKSQEFYQEEAVTLAASLLKELYNRRQEVAFSVNCQVDGEEQTLHRGIKKGDEHFTNILTDLALITPSKKHPLENLLDPLNLALSWGVSLYVLTPRLSEEALNRLIAYRMKGHTVSLIVVGPEIRKDLSLWSIGFQSLYPSTEDGIITLMKL